MAVRNYFKKMAIFSVGCLVFGAVIDGIKEFEKGNRVLRFSDESFYTDSENDREEGVIPDVSATEEPAKVKRIILREVTAYNSVRGQTDSTPCISADGTNICERHKKGECIVAANGYPFKTRLKIDTVGVCTVADRMHPKFGHRVDLFMDKDVKGARNFGKQKLIIAELEDGEPSVRY